MRHRLDAEAHDSALGDRHVGEGVAALLFVARSAVLVAGHTHQDQDEQQAKQPSHNSQQDPAKAQIRLLPDYANGGLLSAGEVQNTGARVEYLPRRKCKTRPTTAPVKQPIPKLIKNTVIFSPTK